MIFFRKKNGDSRSRRNDRLRVLRLRKFTLFFGVFSAIAAAGYAGHHTGSFKKIAALAADSALSRTAAAGFKVRDILVTGRSQIPAEEILARLSIKQNMPVFGIDIEGARKSLAGIPWIESVSISRRLPDTIVVELKERVPAALWQYRKKISVIDRGGAVLTADDLGRWQHLPLIVGADAARHAAELLDLLAAEPAIAGRLVSAGRVGGRRWDLRLQDGLSVRLPEQDAELALRRLAAAEERKNIFGRDIAGIDLRQPEKIVVTPAARDEKTAL